MHYDTATWIYGRPRGTASWTLDDWYDYDWYMGKSSYPPLRIPEIVLRK